MLPNVAPGGLRILNMVARGGKIPGKTWDPGSWNEFPKPPGPLPTKRTPFYGTHRVYTWTRVHCKHCIYGLVFIDMFNYA